MKKYVKLFVVTAVLLFGLTLVGCGAAQTIKEIVDSTHQKWYKYNGSTTLEIPLGEDDNSVTSNTSNTLKNAEIYVYYDHGLTVAVQSVSEQDVTICGGLFSTTQEVVVGGTKKYSEEEFGSLKWTALLAAANFKQQQSAPRVVSDPDHCIIIDKNGASNLKVQWKRFLKEKLIDLLIGE